MCFIKGGTHDVTNLYRTFWATCEPFMVTYGMYLITCTDCAISDWSDFDISNRRYYGEDARTTSTSYPYDRSRKVLSYNSGETGFCRLWSCAGKWSCLRNHRSREDFASRGV